MQVLQKTGRNTRTKKSIDGFSRLCPFFHPAPTALSSLDGCEENTMGKGGDASAVVRPRGLPALHSGAALPKGLKPGRQYTQIRGQVRREKKTKKKCLGYFS